MTLTVPPAVPSASEDAEQIRKAFSGWETNEGLVINILAHRYAEQRKLIRKAYAEAYGEELLTALDKELSNDFEVSLQKNLTFIHWLVLLWTLDPAERDAVLANEATKRWTSSNQVLMEIACTRSADQLLGAMLAYHARNKKSLEEDVAYHTTGDFVRYGGDEVNMTMAKSESKLLH